MISQELLNKILNKQLTRKPIKSKNWITYKYKANPGTTEKSINIYELAFKVRDYIWENHQIKIDMSKDIDEIFKEGDFFYKILTTKMKK